MISGYKWVQNIERVIIITNNSRNIPSHSEIRQIFNDAYNVFYKKWINPDTGYDPAVMIQESRELDRKYNHQDIVNIAALIECIEEERRRNTFGRSN